MKQVVRLNYGSAKKKPLLFEAFVNTCKVIISNNVKDCLMKIQSKEFSNDTLTYKELLAMIEIF